MPDPIEDAPMVMGAVSHDPLRVKCVTQKTAIPAPRVRRALARIAKYLRVTEGPGVCESCGLKTAVLTIGI